MHPNPFDEQFAKFVEKQRQDIIDAIGREWLRVTPNGDDWAWNTATTTTQAPTYAGIVAAYQEAQRIFGKGRFPDLTPEGKPIRLPESGPATPPADTIGVNAMSEPEALTDAELAAKIAEQKAEAEARIAAERATAVQALARTFMGECRQAAAAAFLIMPGRTVDFVGAIGLTRVPFGTYTVVAHAVHGTEGAVLTLRAAKPRTPGGKLDPQLFPRVPVNAVNPVPNWNVFPRRRYGALADILPGTAADGFTPDAWRMLADAIETDLRSIEWQGGGWALTEDHAAFATEFANAIRVLCDAETKRVEDAKKNPPAKVEVNSDGHPMPFGTIHITGEVNTHNHHPKKVTPRADAE